MRQSDVDDELLELAAEFSDDPLGWVLASFDWGMGELSTFADGPDDWQRETLGTIGQKLRDGGTVQDAIQIAVASGHGIGKSALVAWIILWAITTFEDTKGVVTANTENQLKTKTWAEVAKWYRLCLFKHWFHLTATALFSTDADHEKTWRIDMVAWSERNTEAFAGLHNQGKRILLVFDEGSAIPDAIWEVAEGALTDENTQIIWTAFGNPTRNIGRFRECFGKFKHRWHTRQIDSRTVRMTNKRQLNKWVEDYGEDSDFVRVRVRGVFPAAGSDALLGPDEVDAAMARTAKRDELEPFADILGVDVARQGDDASAIAHRRGRQVFPLRELRIPDTMLVAAQVAIDIDRIDTDAVFIDATGGYGVGVVDGLRNMNRDCIEVYFSGKALDQRYFNKRSEMYFELAKWIRAGGCLPEDQTLREELLALTYSFQGDKFRLDSKDDIKDVLGRSPDRADAVALTFAMPVARRPRLPGILQNTTSRLDYRPFT